MAEKTETPKAEPGLDDVRQDLEQLRADVARLIETLGKTAQHKVEGLAGEAQAQAAAAGEWAEGHSVSVRETIREQPLAACAVAAGVGFVLGQILLRR